MLNQNNGGIGEGIINSSDQLLTVLRHGDTNRRTGVYRLDNGRVTHLLLGSVNQIIHIRIVILVETDAVKNRNIIVL